MSARIVVTVNMNLIGIIIAAGGEPGAAYFERDEKTAQGGWLTLPDVDQATADAALAAYDQVAWDRQQDAAAVTVLRDRKLLDGYSDRDTGKTFALDIDSIGKFGSVATAAIAALVLQVPDAKFDLIPADNDTLKDLSAVDALTILMRVFRYGSGVMVYARDLKNRVLVGERVDITQGWPA